MNMNGWCSVWKWNRIKRAREREQHIPCIKQQKKKRLFFFAVIIRHIVGIITYTSSPLEWKQNNSQNMVVSACVSAVVCVCVRVRREQYTSVKSPKCTELKLNFIHLALEEFTSALLVRLRCRSLAVIVVCECARARARRCVSCVLCVCVYFPKRGSRSGRAHCTRFHFFSRFSFLSRFVVYYYLSIVYDLGTETLTHEIEEATYRT